MTNEEYIKTLGWNEINQDYYFLFIGEGKEKVEYRLNYWSEKCGLEIAKLQYARQAELSGQPNGGFEIIFRGIVEDISELKVLMKKLKIQV